MVKHSSQTIQRKEFKDIETLPHRYRIKRSRFRKNYPSLFDYPNEIPKHHTVDRLVTVEQEELNKRIVKQEQEATIKNKSKKEESIKQKPSQLLVVSGTTRFRFNTTSNTSQNAWK